MLAADDDDDATVLADDLSACDEEGAPQNRHHVTSAQAAAHRAAARQHRLFALFLLCLAFLVSVVVATVRYYAAPRTTASSPSGGGELWGSQQREKEDELRFQQTLEYLQKFDVSSPATLAPETNYEVLGGRVSYTPQFQAAYWISKVDQRRISIPSTSEPSREEYPFLQRYALAVLFFATGGLDFWQWRMNFLTGAHECEWLDNFSVEGMPGEVIWGVGCDGRPDLQEDLWSGARTVTDVSLPPFNDMIGTLPPEVRHLRYLKVLHIQHNDGIVGTIPYQYSSLRHLNDLALIYTSLSGKIPRELARLTKLEFLSLNDNRLALDTVNGDLDWVKDLSSLINLSLENNAGIVGTFPAAISELSNLGVLALYNTGLYGTLPPSISKLTMLRGLQLGGCDFEGSVEIINGMTNLSHVYLENNRFNDTIDETFFADLDKLVHLDISNCSFSGVVPGHLFAKPELTVLDMHLNNIGGKLHVDALSDVKESRLEFLSLHSNKISGIIPSSIRKLKNLTVLDLSLNDFVGDIPTEIGNLTELDVLFLGRNNFDDAPVPEWLGNLVAMTELSLKSSSLNGTIPEWLGEMTNLTFLDLGENDLTNTIPQSLGNLTQLMVLILNQNRLQGELGLGQLGNLETLLIDDNELTGNTDDMCEHELVHFIADCARGPNASDGELNCTCCTLCCHDENVTCNDSEWLGNHEGLAEFGYDRIGWDFDEGFVSPLLNYNFWQLFD